MKLSPGKQFTIIGDVTERESRAGGVFIEIGSSWRWLLVWWCRWYRSMASWRMMWSYVYWRGKLLAMMRLTIKNILVLWWNSSLGDKLILEYQWVNILSHVKFYWSWWARVEVKMEGFGRKKREEDKWNIIF